MVRPFGPAKSSIAALIPPIHCRRRAIKQQVHKAVRRTANGRTVGGEVTETFRLLVRFGFSLVGYRMCDKPNRTLEHCQRFAAL
jgi:hypothetical protein